jgi:hypothetical protein
MAAAMVSITRRIGSRCGELGSLQAGLIRRAPVTGADESTDSIRGVSMEPDSIVIGWRDSFAIDGSERAV